MQLSKDINMRPCDADAMATDRRITTQTVEGLKRKDSKGVEMATLRRVWQANEISVKMKI